ncbi:TolC family outer membrane protein [Oceanomicrobium pacificus]|uniref:TolC family outer membrane protein n=1 Tax=Oceanomicrobium pacificus TaxID=2692916 RepID=A0A6B0U560_9RHOB|nr:TolC family outer membrane protein [Oceanomicrobium pacificus]MXU66071.1 TolC family outer membrane protein [Oceanomicrobium pacificus]
MKRRVLAGLLLGASLVPFGAWADTLTDALVAAYQTNPNLEISRAALRALDENVAQARAGLRPTIDFNLNAQGVGGDPAFNDTFNSVRDTYDATLDAALVLYDGGSTPNAIAAAKAAVAAARSSLRDTEQTVLLDAVTAYMDVRRDQDIVGVAENNVTVTGEQVRATTDRFEVGEVTRTDVSQAQARLALSQSQLAAARGALARSVQNYINVVGIPPNNLQPPPAIPRLPSNLSEAQTIAMRSQPLIEAARFNQQAAQYDVERARASSRLNVSVGASVGYGVSSQIDNYDSSIGRVFLRAGVPIYKGGSLPSLVRQAQDVLDRRKAELQNTARLVQQSTAISWANLDVARASIVANEQQITAQQIALEGVTEEARLGARTTLDVLNAELEFQEARVDLISSKRDEYVAAFQLLASMGLLSVEQLRLGIPTYDPDVNYRAVENAPPRGFDTTAIDRISSRWKN